MIGLNMTASLMSLLIVDMSNTNLVSILAYRAREALTFFGLSFTKGIVEIGHSLTYTIPKSIEISEKPTRMKTFTDLTFRGTFYRVSISRTFAPCNVYRYINQERL